MNINYKIIWIDDKFDEGEHPFYDIKTNLNKYLSEEHFFNVDIKTFGDIDEFESEFVKSEFDLIITDYHLNDDKLGSDVVNFIRTKNKVFTEIFFYSAKQGLSTDSDSPSNNSRITLHKLSDGGAYRELESAIKNLIDLTLHKFNHIITVRGMIMNEVSNLDAQMLEIISTYINKTGNHEIINKVLEEMISFHSEKLIKSEKYKRNSSFDKVLSDPIIFSSAQRANAIEDIVNKIGAESFIEDFKLKIIKTRNEFAHAVLVKNIDTGREYFQDKKDGIDFNEDKCKEIRKNIIKHKGNLDNLQKIVSN